MTNLDNILRSSDITLPTNVPLVKAIVFPVIMYVWESWTIKKLSTRMLGAGALGWPRGMVRGGRWEGGSG